MAKLISIVYKPVEAIPVEGGFTRTPLQEANLLAGHGIEGDRKGGNAYRQLNIMGEVTILSLEPAGYLTGRGELGENLVISDIDIESLQPGSRIQIGDSAVIELLELRKPCNRFEDYQGRSLDDAMDKIGWMAAVVSSGRIRVGDAVTILSPEPALAL